jgi:hemolysin III
MPAPDAPRYTLGEEIASAVTHGIGAALGIAALAVLVSLAAIRGGGAWAVVSFSVYGASLVLMFLASTLYHSLVPPRAKRVFRILDHDMIFLVIAGTYTHFLLLAIRGPWGWSLFGAVWALAAAGIVFQSLCVGRARWLATLLYVLLGWLVLVAVRPLAAALPPASLRWLLAGGLAYTLGAALYLLKSLPWHHPVWHLAVLAGALCHFFSIYLLLPPAAP